MAEKIDSIKPTLGGFFTPTGQLRSKQALDKEAKSEAAAKTSQEVSTQKPSTGMDAVRIRSTQEIGKALQMNADTRQELKDAKDVVTQKIQVLKELKNSEADSSKTEELKAKYAELDRKQAAIAKEAENYNRDALTNQVTIRAGNRAYGSFSQAQVQVKAPEAVDLNSKDSIKDAIQRLGDDKQSINAQLRDVNNQHQRIKEAGTQALDEVDNLASGVESRLSADDASNIAGRIADAVRSSTIETALASFNPSKSAGVQAIQNLLSF